MKVSLINKLIISAIILITSFFLFNYGERTNVFYGDAMGYYLYLPSKFIYNNLENLDSLPKNKDIPTGIFTYTRELGLNKTPTGKILSQYTYGVALMEAPFFFIAHIWERLRGLPANGYSPTYYYMVKVSNIIYTLLGLVLVYRILKRYFHPVIAIGTAAVLFCATNLFWFAIYQTGMSHIPLFFLFAVLMSVVMEVHRNPRTLLFFLTGIIAGIITLIRPADIVCLFVPLLYNVYDKESLLQKIKFLKQNIFKVFLFIIAFILPAIPQLIYWKAMSGKYLYYSYGSQGFDWLHPKILDGLFYFSNGWLPYAPVMIFSLVGLFMAGNYVKWKWTILFILPIYIYIIYSWYCYRYINGLGSRPMLDIYPVLALPLAACISYISRFGKAAIYVFGTICIFFTALNISYSMQEAEGLLFSEESNWVFNTQIMFQRHLTYNDLVMNDISETQPDTTKLTKVSTLKCRDYNDSVSTHYVKDPFLGNRYVYHAMNDEISEAFYLVCDKKDFKDAKWIKCSGKFMYPEYPGYFKHLMVFEVSNKVWKGCKIENKIDGREIDANNKKITLQYAHPGKWGYVSFYTRVPKKLTDGDIIKLFVWSTAKTDIYMYDLCMELYK